MLDFHNHLIPGVDDGAATLEESRSALKVMQGQGFRTIITTPHISASSLARDGASDYLRRVDIGWGQLQSLAKSEFPELRLERGFEILLDTPRVDLSDPRLRLGGSRFVLVEFPWSGIPVNSVQSLFDMKMSGYTPVVAHPERYSDMDGELGLAKRWGDAGAFLQVNAGSLVGQYGHRAKALAWACLDRGLANYMCSDYHARGRSPINAARVSLAQALNGEAAFLQLTDVNPQRLLSGLDPESLPNVSRKTKSWWRWITRSLS